MFSTLEIAKQTILQSQTALSVTSNNIANSKVEGYTRQNANITTNIMVNRGHLSIGTGANLTSIDRVRDGFLDKQYRGNLAVYGQSLVLSEGLQRIETYFGGLNDTTGLKKDIGTFFDSLEELSKNPEIAGIKQIVKDAANTVTSSFNTLSHSLVSLKEQYASYTCSKINEINRTLDELNSLNIEISKATALGTQPNDLLDSRDRLLDSLSQSLDISIVHADNNTVNIVSNGIVLLQDSYVNKIEAEVTNNYDINVRYKDGGVFKPTTGELSGYVEIVNTILPKYQNELDTLANEFITNFNNIHSQGVYSDGSNAVQFFTGNSASTIAVNDIIIQDPTKIATSSDGTSGNNDIVKQLIYLQNKKLLGGGEYTVITYFDKISSNIAAETNNSISQSETYSTITKELYNKRANEIGVNEDEELLYSMQHQQLFSAASQILSTLQKMFDDLINAV